MKLSFYFISSILVVIVMLNIILNAIDYVMFDKVIGLNPIECLPLLLVAGLMLDFTLGKVMEILNA